MAHFILFPDPINRPNDIESFQVSGVTIMEWLNERFKVHGAFDRPMMCIVDNAEVPFEDFHTFVPGDNQNVVFTPRVEGFVSLIITIISLVVSVYLALTLTIPESTDSEYNSAPSYTLQGRSNRRKLGEPVEVHFGRITKYYPSYAAASYTRYVSGEQKLYQLFCVGYGDQEFTPDDIRIKDTPINNYEDVELEVVRPFNQPTLFATNVESSVNVSNIELLGTNEAGYPGFYGPFTAGSNPLEDNVYKIEIDIEWPNGLFKQANDGSLDKADTDVEAYYQELDENGAPVGSEVKWLDVSKNTVSTKAIRKTYKLETPNPEATYTIKVGRTNTAQGNNKLTVTDKVLWTGLRAFKSNEADYGNVTLLAVETTASSSISGSAAQSVNLDFTAYTCHPVGGKMVYGPNRSIVAAFIALFTMEYGANLPSEVMDWDTLLAIDAEMESQGRYFDWTFDQNTTVWEAAKAIARCARATPIMSGSYITMKRDVIISHPEAIFTPYNMVENSFSKNFRLSKINDSDGVEIEYIDETTGEQTQMLCLLGDDEGFDPQRIQYIGQKNRDWAYREGLFIRAQQKLQREQVTFTTGMEGLPVQYGSRISVASGVDQKESVFGRVVDIVGTTITVDQPLSFNIGITEAIVIRTNTGGVLGPYVVTEGVNEFEAILSASIPNDWQTTDKEDAAFFVFGEQTVSDYKVTSVIPLGEEEVQIEAINYDEAVYSFDNETAPSFIDPPVIPQIPDLPIISSVVARQFYDLTVAEITWEPALGATSYVLQTSFDGVEFTSVGEFFTTNASSQVQKGDFWVRVAGIGSARGPWATWTGPMGVASVPPPDVGNFRLLNQFVGPSCETIWDAAPIADSYNVKLYTVPGDVLVFDDSVLQTSYSFTAEDVATVTTVVRDYRLELLAVNTLGTSPTASELIVNNPLPVVPSNLTSTILTEDENSFVVQVSWSPTSATDFRTYRVWASDTSGFTPSGANQVYDGTANSANFVVNKTNGTIPDFYWIVATLDVWGDDTNYSPEQSTDPFINVLAVNDLGDTLEVSTDGDELSVN